MRGDVDALVVLIAYDPADSFITSVMMDLAEHCGSLFVVEADGDFADEGFMLWPSPLEGSGMAPAGSIAIYVDPKVGSELVNERADELWGSEPDWARHSFLLGVNGNEPVEIIAERLLEALVGYGFWMLEGGEDLPLWAVDYDRDNAEVVDEWIDGIFDAMIQQSGGWVESLPPGTIGLGLSIFAFVYIVSTLVTILLVVISGMETLAGYFSAGATLGVGMMVLLLHERGTLSSFEDLHNPVLKLLAVGVLGLMAVFVQDVLSDDWTTLWFGVLQSFISAVIVATARR